LDLRAQHKERFKVVFDEDVATKEREIEVLTMGIVDIFREAEGTIKRIAADTERENISDRERKVRTNMHISMATKLKDLSGRFRKIQKTYLGF